jgi:hypothetical protein
MDPDVLRSIEAEFAALEEGIERLSQRKSPLRDEWDTRLAQLEHAPAWQKNLEHALARVSDAVANAPRAVDAQGYTVIPVDTALKKADVAPVITALIDALVERLAKK